MLLFKFLLSPGTIAKASVFTVGYADGVDLQGLKLDHNAPEETT